MRALGDLIVDWTLFTSFVIAIAWVIGNPLVIIIGYYLRDRSHDDDPA